MGLKQLLLRKPTLKFFIGFHIFTPFFVPKTTIGLDGIINYLGLIYIINQSFNIVLFNVLWGCSPKPKVVLVCFFNDFKIFYAFLNFKTNKPQLYLHHM